MNTSIKATIQRLKLVLYQRGVSPQDVDDIIQESYHRLEKYQQDNEVRNVDGFLVRTAANIVIDRSRVRKWEKLSDDPDTLVIADDAPRPDEIYASRRRLERLNDGLAKLDPLTQQLIKENRIDGITMARIAEQRGMTVSAIEKRMAKGLKFLMSWMDGW